MSLSGITESVLTSHLSSEASFHTTCADLSESEYLKLVIAPAFRPKTFPSRGPSLSLSSAWHPPHRFSNNSFPRCTSPVVGPLWENPPWGAEMANRKIIAEKHVV